MRIVAVQHLTGDIGEMKARYEGRTVRRDGDCSAEADDGRIVMKCNRAVEVSSHHVIENVTDSHQGEKRRCIIDMTNDLQP